MILLYRCFVGNKQTIQTPLKNKYNALFSEVSVVFEVHGKKQKIYAVYNIIIFVFVSNRNVSSSENKIEIQKRLVLYFLTTFRSGSPKIQKEPVRLQCQL